MKSGYDKAYLILGDLNSFCPVGIDCWTLYPGNYLELIGRELLNVGVGYGLSVLATMG